MLQREALTGGAIVVVVEAVAAAVAVAVEEVDGASRT